MNRKQRRAAQHKKFSACTQDYPGPYRLPTEVESEELTKAIYMAILAELQDPVVRELETRAHIALAMRALALLIKAGGANPLDYFASVLFTLGSLEEIDAALHSACLRAGLRRICAND